MQIAGRKKLPEDLVVQITERSDGVPLFVEELTKSVLESGLLREESDRYVLDRALQPLAIPAMTLHASLLLARLRPPCIRRDRSRRSARRSDASFLMRCCTPSAAFPMTSCKPRSAS